MNHAKVAHLPPALANHVQRLLSSDALGATGPARTLALRLASEENMREVWTTLAKHAPDEQALPDFFELVRLRPELMQLPRPEPRSTADLRNAFRAVTKRARELEAALSNLAQGNQQGALWEVSRLLNLALSATSAGNVAGVDPIAAERLRAFDEMFLGDGEDAPPVPLADALPVLADACEAAAMAAQRHLPRKALADTADRTQLIRDTSVFVTKRFRESLDHAVAVTLNVALDLRDTPITEDLVRKLTRPRKT